MAIKAGQILHTGNGFVIDRIQSAGVGNVNIPEEKIYELGNYNTVATIRDIPDLSFDMESFDMSTEIESLLLNLDPTTSVNGDAFDFGLSVPLDIVSPFKAGSGAFNIVKGLAVPYLNLERATYRFGLKQSASAQFTLRGDSIYYIPGSPYYQTFTNAGAVTYSFTNTALEYVESGNSNYALSVCLHSSTTPSLYKRLFYGTDYTNTSTGFTLLANTSATYNRVSVVYGSATAATYNASVHQGTSVKAAGIRGKDIDVYVSDGAATPTWTRWAGVQTAEMTRSVNIENDEEFGNSKFVSSGYDTADVTGSIGIKAVDADELWSKIAAVTNVATNKIAGPQSSIPLGVEIRVSDPDTSAVVKTIYCPDARFVVPGVQGRVQTKLETTFSFTSDSGSMTVYKGARP
jgi:hypothetical protein